ncbi:MAG TPA: aldo/keto reductase [Candidatus Saccharimonadales bacterium]|nr:aldo/keto reductase [Candidatus Saccharimonadales bacterium]
MNLKSTITLHTGREMPIIGLGTWQLTKDTPGTIQEALGLGYPMIDTSGDYGTQPGIGDGIQKSGFERSAFYLVTKVEEDDDAYEATKDDLAELGLSYADLMLLHRPPASGAGEDLWRGLMRARDDGLTKDIGVSNYSIEQLQELIDNTGEVPVVNQIEWSPFGHSKEMLGYCQENGIVIQAYSPLTRGERLDDQTVQEIAAAHGKTPGQIMIRWSLQQQGVVPIIKANSLDHLEENIKVFDFKLSEDDMRRLDSLNEEFSALGSHQLSYN